MRPLPPFGALPTEDGVRFSVWAPRTRRVELLVPERAPIALTPAEDGVHQVFVPGLQTGARYRYCLDGGEPVPDPASRFQPEGVHGPSEVIALPRGDRPPPPRHADRVVYELHIGTFTPEGTYAAAEAKLDELAALGITTLELMPLHAFPGRRGWGYDPAALFAPHAPYGRPEALVHFLDAAHREGLEVLLDVVYNHLGPDGASWAAFGPVLTARHPTPWGEGMNLDDPESRGVRDMLLANALYWLGDYGFDGLRLDAIFALVDDSEEHLLAELSRRVEALPGAPRWLVAEDHRNEELVLRERTSGGHGLGGVWADDFHHLMRRRLTGDKHHYLATFPSDTAPIAECLSHNWYRRGQPERGGTDASHLAPGHFVCCIQNHDQIGNRPRGDRLQEVIAPEALRAATALLLFVPQTPMLFMGQEWAATTPFRFFCDHGKALAEKVRRGRIAEFGAHPGFAGDVPDPQSEATFRASILRHEEKTEAPHAAMLALHGALLALRRELLGSATAESPSEGLIRAQRGAHTLLVSLDGDGELEAEGEVVFSTEEPRFGGDDSLAIRDGVVRFGRPGAVVIREP